ncbi:hypothetical protein D3C78_1406430 [compost metagenome]
MDAINGEQLLPQLDQPALPDRRQQLLGGDGGGEFGVTQMFAPGGNRAGGDDNDAVTRCMLLCALANQFDNMGTVKTQRSAGQHAGAQFHNQCLAAVHSISAVGVKRNANDVVTGETRYANRHNAISA